MTQSKWLGGIMMKPVDPALMDTDDSNGPIARTGQADRRPVRLNAPDATT